MTIHHDGRDGHRGPAAAVAASIAGALAVGAVVEITGWAGAPLAEVRHSTELLTGAFFLAAGLLQLAMWRADREPLRGSIGLALLTLGLLTPRISALGPVIHDSEAAQILSPWTAAMIALVTMVVGGLGRDRLDRFVAHPRALGTGVVAGFLVLLYIPVAVNQGLPAPADVPAPVHLTAEVTVAALWLLVALRVSRAIEVSGIGSWAPAALGVVWLLRAVAVLDVHPWSAAATTLMALTGLIALVSASVALARSTEESALRAAEVADALREVAAAFDALSAQRRAARHDARNALLALRLASRTLLDHGPDLDEPTRRRLQRAIDQGLAELESLAAAPLPTPAALRSHVGAQVSAA